MLEQLRLGLTNPQIAEQLGISPDGVKYHVSNMLAKLALVSREDLAAWRGDPKAAPVPWWRVGILAWFLRGWAERAAAGLLALAVLVLAGVLLAVIVYGWPDDEARDVANPSPLAVASGMTDSGVEFTARQDGDQVVLSFKPLAVDEPAQDDAVFAWTDKEGVRRLVQPNLNYDTESDRVSVRVPAPAPDDTLTVEFGPAPVPVPQALVVTLTPTSADTWSGTANVDDQDIPIEAVRRDRGLEVRSTGANRTPYILLFDNGAVLADETGAPLAVQIPDERGPAPVPPAVTLTSVWQEPWVFEAPLGNGPLTLMMPGYAAVNFAASLTLTGGDIPRFDSPQGSDASSLAGVVERFVEVNLRKGPYVGDCPGRDDSNPAGTCTSRIAGGPRPRGQTPQAGCQGSDPAGRLNAMGTGNHERGLTPGLAAESDKSGV